VRATIQPARSTQEFLRLRNLFEAYESDLPRELRHGAVPAAEALAQVFAGRNAAFLASIEGNDAGCVAVRALDPTTAQLRHLFVAPAHRRLGVARSLTAAAIEFARTHHYVRMVLDTEKSRLKAAYLLYRSFGFEECEPFAAVSYKFPTFMELRLD
jgi:GNAT superfamily N-acetyltransferase